jgi:hypothetical protein
MGEITMETIEKPFHQKNKLAHPTIEDVAHEHNQLLNDMFSFPMKNNLSFSSPAQSPLRTPNDMYKDYLLQKIKSYKEQTSEKE